MKNLIILASLTSASILTAGHHGYDSNCPDCDRNSGYYQGNRSQSYDQGQPYSQSNRSQGYSQDQQYYQGDRNQGYSQDQQYNQGNRNQNYNDTRSNWDNSANRDANYQNRDTKVLSDQEINDRIRDAIGSGWFSKGYQNVTYTVRDRYVSLRGSVETIDDKKNVEDAIRKIDGVRSIDNQVMVVKLDNSNKNDSYNSDRNGYNNSSNADKNANRNAYTDAQLLDSEKKYTQDTAVSSDDRQLNARIRDKVSNGWFTQSYKNITFKTNNGVVTISGNVDNRDDVQKLIDQLKGIEGVRSVNSQITVRNS